ncbi:MAG: carbonic anhydrase [Planctomycetes bacterium]|nr:carbonic anhydrase [Planctomycetota bacterium]
MRRTPGPEQALSLLKEGNARFAAGRGKHPNLGRPRLKETAAGGGPPLAAVLSCCDPRVPVELVFDVGVGDLFVARVAGYVCGADEAASLDYAVVRLGVPLIVVLGHTDCRLVNAVVLEERLPFSLLSLSGSVRLAVAAARRARPDLEGQALLREAAVANVWQSIEDLSVRAPLVREAARAKRLHVVGALYDVADGTVRWLGHHPDQARLFG